MAERRLGRGLGSLLSSSPARAAIRGMRDMTAPEGIVEVPIEAQVSSEWSHSRLLAEAGSQTTEA